MSESFTSEMLLKEAAPSGRLRIGLNYSNFLLVSGDDSEGEPTGIAPDIGRQLAQRLGLSASFRRFDSAGELADAVRDADCDVGFLAIELQRAEQIAFADAYLEIDTTYMVSPDSGITDIADVDRPGVRIAVVERSAYDLWLTRNIKQATLVRAATLEDSLTMFRAERLEVVASLRTALLNGLKAHPGARILEGSFMSVQQAIGTPKTRTAASAYLNSYVRDIKASNIVEQLIRKHGLLGVSVAR